MSFTSRVKETGQIFQATTDMGTDGTENHVARLPIERDHTYWGHLFTEASPPSPTPGIFWYNKYETATFEGCELEETSFDKITLIPARKKTEGQH
jgi:hypothetical protein